MDQNIEYASISAGRLALRTEGSRLVAYFAQKHTMDEAIEIGSISMMAVMENSLILETFQHLMKLCISQLLGAEFEFTKYVPAPESDKCGHA